MAETRDTPLVYDRAQDSDIVATVKDDRRIQFLIGRESRKWLAYFIRNATMAEQTAMQDIWAPYLVDHTWANLYHDIADVYSSIFRSSHNGKIVELEGEAYSLQTFVTVRWVWFIGPLVIVFGSLSFLAFTIVRSHRRDHLVSQV